MTIYLFFQCPHIEIGWFLKGSTQNLPKYKMHRSRRSKHYHAANFLKGAQCQTDNMPVPDVLCSLLAAFGAFPVEPAIMPLGVLQCNRLQCQMPYMFPVKQKFFLVFKRYFQLKVARLKLTLGSCSLHCAEMQVQDRTGACHCQEYRALTGPDCQQLQHCRYIVIALTMSRQEASHRQRSGLLSGVGTGWHRGPLAGFPLQLGLLCQQSKFLISYAQQLQNEKLFYFICMQGVKGGTGLRGFVYC